MAKVIKITDDGLKKLEEELEYLKTEGRADIAEKIKVARGYGDLSENSEYDEEIIEDVKGNAKTVVVGVTVKVLDEEYGDECEYRVVGSTEADPRNGKISDESPVGKALLGKKIGEEVIVEAPGGEFKLKVLGISK